MALPLKIIFLLLQSCSIAVLRSRYFAFERGIVRGKVSSLTMVLFPPPEGAICREFSAIYHKNMPLDSSRKVRSEVRTHWEKYAVHCSSSHQMRVWWKSTMWKDLSQSKRKNTTKGHLSWIRRQIWMTMNECKSHGQDFLQVQHFLDSLNKSLGSETVFFTSLNKNLPCLCYILCYILCYMEENVAQTL